MKTKAENSQKKKRSLLIRLALILFAGYIIVMLVQLQMQLDAKQAEINDKEAQKVVLREANEALENDVSHADEYLEQQAKKEGRVKGNEDVYIEVNR